MHTNMASCAASWAATVSTQNTEKILTTHQKLVSLDTIFFSAQKKTNTKPLEVISLLETDKKEFDITHSTYTE